MQHGPSRPLILCLISVALAACAGDKKRTSTVDDTVDDGSVGSIDTQSPSTTVRLDSASPSGSPDAAVVVIPQDAQSKEVASSGPDAPTDKTAAPDARGPDAPPATFAAVSMMLQVKCVGCHGPTDPNAFLFSATGLYARLIAGKLPTKAPAACKLQQMIVPGMPSKSLLYNMVVDDPMARGGCGDRMPSGCQTDDTCLTTAELKMISDWITAGAKM